VAVVFFQGQGVIVSLVWFGLDKTLPPRNQKIIQDEKNNY
jgi:hypothetical protein